MSEPTVGDAPTSDPCAHYWMLSAPARGGTSGQCKRCGERREFLEADGRPAWSARRAKSPPTS